MSKRDAKRDEDEEEEEDDEEDEGLSSSGSDSGDSGSDEEMSESGSDHDEKATPGDGKGSKGAAPGAREKGTKLGNERSLHNQPFDEAVDLSESEDMSEAGKNSPKKTATTKTVKNMPFDEALELSASAQDLESPVKKPPPQQQGSNPAGVPEHAGDKGKDAASDIGAEVKNRPFDEEVDLSDSGESVDTNGPSSPDKASMKNQKARATASQPVASASAAAAKPKDAPPATAAPAKIEDKPKPEEKKPAAAQPASKPAPAATRQPEKNAPEPKRKEESESSSGESGSEEDDDDEEDDEDEDEEEEEEEVAPSKQQKGGARSSGGGSGGGGGGGAASAKDAAATSAAHATMMASAGAYKESDFANLKVSNEVKELFQYIGRFKPQEIELETRLKCFIPEYIPAVGDMDAFLKIPRPDGEPDLLGLKMLDEPSLQQSDATVLDLQLRSTSKKKHGDIVVRSIENAEKSPKEIDRWIKSIADLHRTKPPPQVHYTKPMPDIESLMQVWPDEFEELLGKATLPGASLDISLEQYIRVICAVLDIPVYKNVYESLHVLFTLYLEFRSNQHFMNYDDQLDLANARALPLPATSRREEVSVQDDYPASRK